jgi:hypothetical protein
VLDLADRLAGALSTEKGISRARERNIKLTVTEDVSGKVDTDKV